MKMNSSRVCKIKNIRTLINLVRSDEVGWFEYQGKAIFIGYRNGVDGLGLNRKQRLYKRRRSQGLCVACGKKVEGENRATGKPFKLCDEHRQKSSKRER